MDFERYKIFYESLGNVYCAKLKSTVHFNSRGWRHLVRNGHGKVRGDAKKRLALLNYAKEIIQETDVDCSSRTQATRGVNLQYYALDSRKYPGVRVIIQRQNSGMLTFLSVMQRN
jgi:hypothetical protein